MGGFTQPEPVVRPRRQRKTATGGVRLHRARHHRAGSQGFIAMVMLVLLTLILGSLAMVARTSSGRVASAAQGRNREARDVAEAGLTEIISELNKERNRKLLVSGVPPANWSQGSVDRSNPLVNPCTSYDGNGNPVTVGTPTSKAIALKNGWQPLVPGDNTRSYQLVSVAYRDALRTEPLPPLIPSPDPVPPLRKLVDTGQVKTLLLLTVEGRVSNAAGTVLSTARVVKEYEVVPKCCKRSFGSNSFAANIFGTDTRACFLSSGGVLNAEEAVAAVIGGLNGGVIRSSNNTLNIFDAGLRPVTRVLCRSNVPAPGVANPDCINATMRLGTISVMPSRFSVPIPPWPGDGDRPFATLQAPSQAGLYIRVNASSNVVEKCNLSGSSLSGCEAMSSCEYVGGETGYVNAHYCRISGIDADKNSVTFDTSNAPLYIYMDTPQAPASSDKHYISYQGNGAVRQVRCAAGSAGVCGVTAGIADVERLNVYAWGAGSMNLNGADAVVTMNVFAPNASFTIRGGRQRALQLHRTPLAQQHLC